MPSLDTGGWHVLSGHHALHGLGAGAVAIVLEGILAVGRGVLAGCRCELALHQDSYELALVPDFLSDLLLLAQYVPKVLLELLQPLENNCRCLVRSKHMFNDWRTIDARSHHSQS